MKIVQEKITTLENNVRLVSFKDQKIDISLNSSLSKTFVKELSAKLLEWTNKRWIITFSKEIGQQTLKEKKLVLHADLLKKESDSKLSKEVKELFPDAVLSEIEEKDKT